MGAQAKNVKKKKRVAVSQLGTIIESRKEEASASVIDCGLIGCYDDLPPTGSAVL